MTQSLREALPVETGGALAAHLERCSRCRTEQAELREFENTLAGNLTADWAEAPAVRLNAREIASQAGVSDARGSTARILAVAAFAGAGAVAMMLLSAPRGDRQRQTEAPAPINYIRSGKHDGTLTIPTAPGREPRVRQSPFARLEATTAVIPDPQYLNGADPRLTAEWMTGSSSDADVRKWLTENLPPVQDDFVSVPLPRLVSADKGSAAAKGAIKEYEKEAAVVDVRLFRKVTIEQKGASLAEVCQSLSGATGVRILASRGVADEKATVLVKDRPAREVMRELTRLFGFQWSRAGEDGHYVYELLQDLRSQLAEEEMRSRDLNAALIALDEQVQNAVPNPSPTAAQLAARMERASGPERERLRNLLRGGWGVAQVYRHLSPAELTQLRNGEELEFSDTSSDPARRLPAEWRPMLAQTSRDVFISPDTGQRITPADEPDATVRVSVKINRSEAGQLTLEGFTSFDSKAFSGGVSRVLATGRSPSTASPDNAAGNKHLAADPAFQALVTLHPESRCPGDKPLEAPYAIFSSGDPLLGTSRSPGKHVHSDDAWEEVYRRTGRPIIADYYTRRHAAGPLQIEKKRLFDALCATGDALGVRWRADGDYLLARSTSYFWDKLKEVPGRLIEHWQADARMPDGLPVRDLLEMAALTEPQLDSKPVGEAMARCKGLEEWLVVGGGPDKELRPWARFLSRLQPQQLAAALSPEGFALDSLFPNQQAEWLRVYHSPPNPGMRLRVEYVPAGRFIWMPSAPEAKASQLSRLPVLSARTIPEGIAAARRYLPGTKPTDFRRSAGVLAVIVGAPGEEGMAYRRGKPPVLIDPAGGG